MEAVERLLTDQGMLGVGCIILMGVVATLWRRVNTVQDARLQELKEFNAALTEVGKEMSRSLDALRNMVEGMRRD